MGCKCKEQAGKLSKYTDDKEKVMIPMTWLEKIVHFFTRIIMIALAVGVCGIVLPFFLVYMFIKMLLGQRVQINLSKLIRRDSNKS